MDSSVALRNENIQFDALLLQVLNEKLIDIVLKRELS